ncbi:MAG: hypothetical protein ABI743_06945 [bacterium]
MPTRRSHLLMRWILPLLGCLCWITLVAPVSAGPFLAPQSETLPNGITLVQQAWSGEELGDQVLFTLAFRGGVIEEKPSLRGVTHEVLEALSRAVRETVRTPGDPDAPVVGAELDAEYAALQVAMPAETFPTWWPTILDMSIKSPETLINYAPGAEETLQILGSLAGDGGFMADVLAKTNLLGNSPYVNPLLGTPVTLQALERGDLEDWARRLLTPSRLVVIVVHPRGVNLTALRDALAILDTPTIRPLDAPQVPLIIGRREALRPMETTVPTISWAILGPAVREPDLPAFLVVAAALGDPDAGRFAALRATGAGQAIQTRWELERHQEATIATFQASQEAGADIFALYTRWMDLHERLLATGLTADEVAFAQGSLHAALDTRATDPVAMSSWLTLWSIWENLTAGRRFDDKVSEVTLDEANAALRKYFGVDHLIIAGLAPQLPDDYYFPNPRDVLWGTFVHPNKRTPAEIPPPSFN